MGYEELLEEEMKRNNKSEKDKEPSRMSKLVDKMLLIFAWTLSYMAVFISAFFVILYSMQWGADRSNAWFIAFLISFVQNALILDPLKVIETM